MLLLLTLVLPSPFDLQVKTARVDLVEVNHYHDTRGEHVFDQLIFYDWSTQRKRFDVRDWRLLKSESMIPMAKRGHFFIRWHDDGLLREVTALSRRESWTQYDPELLERDHLHQEERLPLFIDTAVIQ